VRRVVTLLMLAALVVAVQGVMAGPGAAEPQAGAKQYYCTTGFPPNGFTSFYTTDKELVKEVQTQGYMCTSLDFDTTVPQTAQSLPGPEGYYCTTGFDPNGYVSFHTTDKKLAKQAELDGFMCTKLDFK
jgi:hypothetical protein